MQHGSRPSFCVLVSVQIRTSLAAAASSVQVKDVRLIRDKSTNTSRGFCFIEMATVQVRRSVQALTTLYMFTV